MGIGILRLGHRFSRDFRISTHLALTARAFGASFIMYDAKATDVKESVDSLTQMWGGDFEVIFIDDAKKQIRDFKGTTVHLTMYGIPVWQMLDAEKIEGDVLVIVGGKKVPSDIYGLVDHNVSVGSQPHSEVAALAVFLDRLTHGEGIKTGFVGYKTIIPQKAGKKVV